MELEQLSRNIKEVFNEKLLTENEYLRKNIKKLEIEFDVIIS